VDLDLSLPTGHAGQGLEPGSEDERRRSFGKRRSSGSGTTNGHSSSENSLHETHQIFPASPSPCSSLKRMRVLPPPSQRLMIYVRQEGEEAFTPLHLVPPSRETLLKAVRPFTPFTLWKLEVE